MSNDPKREAESKPRDDADDEKPALSEAELDQVAGGIIKKEASAFNTLSNTASSVLDGIGKAISTAARSG